MHDHDTGIRRDRRQNQLGVERLAVFREEARHRNLIARIGGARFVSQGFTHQMTRRRITGFTNHEDRHLAERVTPRKQVLKRGHTRVFLLKGDRVKDARFRLEHLSKATLAKSLDDRPKSRALTHAIRPLKEHVRPSHEGLVAKTIAFFGAGEAPLGVGKFGEEPVSLELCIHTCHKHAISEGKRFLIDVLSANDPRFEPFGERERFGER